MRTLVSLALLASIPAAAVEPRTPLPAEAVYVGPHDVALVVKWADHLRARPSDTGQVRLGGGRAPVGLSAVSTQWGLSFEPWLQLPERRLSALEARAEARSGRAQPDLAGLHRVQVRNPTPERLRAAAAALLRLDEVEFVTTDALAVPPPGDLSPTTPDLVDRQGWLDPDPGIDAWTAWNEFGLDGAGIRLADCEYGWHHDHEDLVDGVMFKEPGQTPHPDVASRGWDHHGTAVAGEVFGQHNAYGVSGIAPGSTFATYPEWTLEEGGRRGSAIASAIDDSAPGDVVLLEMQAGGPDGRYAPAEVNSAVWAVVRVGTDAGVIVVGAAGNGAADLDSAVYESYRARGDSGAIIVGAGSANASHSRMSFSTYGARVNVHGWGQSVFTTGYGGFARYGGSDLQSYTSSFSGTSSASPFVAGSAVLLQEMALRYRTEPLDPATMREILVSTGTPAATGTRIGPLPDLAAALDEIETRYDVLPQIDDIAGKRALTEGESVTLTFEATVLPTLEAELWWEVDGVRTDGAALTLQPTDDGVLQATAFVRDEWGRTDEEVVDVVVDNAEPVVTALDAAGERLEGSTVELAVSLFDAGSDDTHTVAWTVDGESLGSGPTLQWVPPDDGTYTLGAVATDDDGGVSEPLFVDVVVDDVPATLTLDVPDEAPRKTDTELVVLIDDPGDDTHTVEWVLDAEEGVTAAGPAVTHQWRRKGTQRISVTVTDEDGVVVEADVTLEVVPRGGCGCDTGASPWSALGLLGLLGLTLRRRRR